uniref:Uncharacterized protein LOC114343194 n=1 Tax=Diabrotica virgifera virgifera TaxID=50390 RepID=A0A6P7H189_DIAVI
MAVNSSSYDILVLVESNLCCDYLDSELECQNYNIYRNDRSSLTSQKSRGGGILVYVRKKNSSARIHIEQVTVEQLFISCNFKSIKFIIGGLYIPPKMPEIYYNKHCEAVENMLQRFPLNKIYLFGDYKLPDAGWFNDDYGVRVECPGTSNAVGLAQQFGFLQLYQLNEIPNSRNIYLDLLFTNDKNVQLSKSKDFIFADSLHHFSYECTLNLFSNNQDSSTLYLHDFYYDFKNANYFGLNNFLASVQWEQCFSNNINDSVNNCYEILDMGIALFVPLKKYISRTQSVNINTCRIDAKVVRFNVRQLLPIRTTMYAYARL